MGEEGGWDRQGLCTYEYTLKPLESCILAASIGANRAVAKDVKEQSRRRQDFEPGEACFMTCMFTKSSRRHTKNLRKYNNLEN